MKVNNKTFVVTGAGGGIGGELVRQLIQGGANVAAVDINQEQLDDLANELNADNALSLHVCNIADRKSVESLVDDAIKAHSAIDGLINCAGIIQPFVKINELEYEAIERVMDVNFYGTAYMTKAFLPSLLKRPEAAIVNYSSMGGFLPVPGQSVYGASKAAVKLFTEALFAELQDTNVEVAVVFPGATDTNIAGNSGVAVDVEGAEDQSFPMLSAAESARIVIKGIEASKPQILTGKDSKLMNKLYRLNPVFATKLIAKQMKSLLD